MTELKITQADIDRAHEWMRGQTTGLRMMLVKPRGIYEILAAHRIAAEEGKAELVKALEALQIAYCDSECNGDAGLHDTTCINARAALARVRREE